MRVNLISVLLQRFFVLKIFLMDAFIDLARDVRRVNVVSLTVIRDILLHINLSTIIAMLRDIGDGQKIQDRHVSVSFLL